VFKKDKVKKTFLLLFILIFPSAFYVYLTAGKEKSFVRLPYYGPKQTIKITKKGKTAIDTIFYSIPSFDFYNQYEQNYSAEDVKGRIWVCCFIHLQDKQISPSMAVMMDRVESRTDLDTALKIVNFTLDSETVKSLSDYDKMVHAGRKQYFVSGKQSALNDFAAKDFYAPVDSSFAKGFLYFFLIDKEGCIRGIYNGLHIKEVDYLIDNISELETAYAVKENHDKSKKGEEDEDAM
jgi:protein SCO1/2